MSKITYYLFLGPQMLPSTFLAYVLRTDAE